MLLQQTIQHQKKLQIHLELLTQQVVQLLQIKEFHYLLQQHLQTFADVTYSSASFTANGAMIYNTTTDGGSGTTDAVAIIAFGGDKTASNGTFKIEFPAAASYERNHQISIGGRPCRYLQDGAGSPGAKLIGTKITTLKQVGVQSLE